MPLRCISRLTSTKIKREGEKERGDGNRVGSLKRRWEEGRKSREKIGRGWDV